MRRSAGRGSLGKDGLGLRSVSRFGSLPALFRAENRPKLEARRRLGGRREPPLSLPEMGRPGRLGGAEPGSRTRRFMGRLELGAGAEEGAPPRAAPAPPRQRFGRRAVSPSRAPGPRSAGALVADEWANVLRSPSLFYTPAKPLRETGTRSRAQIFSPFF